MDAEQDDELLELCQSVLESWDWHAKMYGPGGEPLKHREVMRLLRNRLPKRERKG